MSEIDRALNYQGRYHMIMKNNLRNIKGAYLWVLGPLAFGGLLSLYEGY